MSEDSSDSDEDVSWITFSLMLLLAGVIKNGCMANFRLPLFQTPLSSLS